MTKKRKMFLSLFVAIIMIIGCCKITAYPIAAVSNTSGAVGIEDDTVYCIMNHESGRILSLEWVSTEIFTNIIARTRENVPHAQWRTELLSNGKFRFINEHIGNAQRLYISSTGNADTNTTNDSVREQFEIRRVDDPNSIYDGLYLIINQGKYLTQNSIGDFHNVCCTDTVTSYSYWSFMKVEKRNADFFYFDYPVEDVNNDGIIDNFDTSGARISFMSTFNSFQYTWSTHLSSTVSYAYDTCLTDRDDVFIFAGHGAPGLIGFYDDEGTCTGVILAHSSVASLSTPSNREIINALSDNALSDLRMVIYLGCETGVSFVRNYTEHNLVDYTYDKGAHFVLGTTEVMFNTTINELLQVFLDVLCVNSEISYAINFANDYVGNVTYPRYNSSGHYIGDFTGPMPLYYRGDTSQFINVY